MVPQGSGGAALASGCDLAQGLENYFAGSQDEITYGSVRCNPLAYQDDICRLAGNLNSMRAGNIKLASMMDEKGLQCHPTKTVCIVIGTKQSKQKVKSEVEQDPIKFSNFDYGQLQLP